MNPIPHHDMVMAIASAFTLVTVLAALNILGTAAGSPPISIGTVLV